MPFASVNGGQLYYETHGSGPPLLLVTGLNGVAAHWKPQVDALASHYTVIVYDQRGCGQSSAPPSPCSIEHMADDTVQLLDALGIDSAHLAGHSTGAAIGMVIATSRGKRLRKLTLLSGWARPDAYFRRVMSLRRELLIHAGVPQYVRAGAVFLYPPAWVNDNATLLEGMEARISQYFPAPQVMADRIDAVLNFEGTDRLPAIKVPTLVMVADNDILTPVRFSRELAAGIQDSQLAILDGGAHMFTSLNSMAVNGTLRQFLDK